MNDERSHVLTQGMFAGLIGYAGAALLLLVLDLAAGRPAFYTPALLGEALFYGLGDPSRVTLWPGPVLAMNGLHLLPFLVLGVVAAWLVEMSEHGPHFWYIGLILFLVVLFHAQGLAMGLAGPVQAALSPWAILGSGAVAAAAMAAYLLWAHPRLRAQLHDDGGALGTHA